MASHGLADHGHDYLIIVLLFTKKGNLTTLMKDKPSYPHILSEIQWLITFSDVQDQILKKVFLSKA
jgi:hypothetical protein